MGNVASNRIHFCWVFGTNIEEKIRRAHLGVVILSSLVLKSSRSFSAQATTLSSSPPRRWGSL